MKKGYYTNVTQKIEMGIKIYLNDLNNDNGVNNILNDTIIIKYSGDSTNITKSRLKILNFTYTIINDERNCKSANGNYILGKLKIY